MLEIAPQDSRGPCDDGAAIGVELFEDAQVRVARCTFPPGAVHVCHSPPSYLHYVASGGRSLVQDEKGTRKAELTAGTFAETPPIPWHELANVGDTTLQFIVIEKKYQPPQIAEQLRARRVRVRDPSKNKSPV